MLSRLTTRARLRRRAHVSRTRWTEPLLGVVVVEAEVQIILGDPAEPLELPEYTSQYTRCSSFRCHLSRKKQVPTIYIAPSSRSHLRLLLKGAHANGGEDVAAAEVALVREADVDRQVWWWQHEQPPTEVRFWELSGVSGALLWV